MVALRTLDSDLRYGETESATYLGFPMVLTQAHVTVSTPDGRMVGRVRTLSAARALVRGYRKPLGRSTT